MIKFFKNIEKLDIVVLTTLMIVCIISSINGYISPDSWVYLHLAQSIGMGEGLTIQGKPFAIFPPGYSFLIALVSGFSTNIFQLITASKILNFILAFLSYIYAKKIFKEPYIALFFVLNPLYLYIVTYTWSENLFYFSILASIYYLLQVNTQATITNLAKLTSFLLLTISARYFGGVFLFTLFITYLVVYGKDKFLLKLLPFTVAGISFIAYQALNKYLTGYSTGMPRIEAPETFKYIFMFFIYSNLRMLLAIIPLIIVFFIFKAKLDFKNSNNKKLSTFLSIVGILYLTDHLILRSLSQYDLFGTRILGFGVILLCTSVVYYFFNFKKINFIAVIFFVPLSFYLSGIRYLDVYDLPKANPNIFNKYANVISLNVKPNNSDFVTSQARNFYEDRDEYYGYNVNTIRINGRPFFERDTTKSLRNKLKGNNIESCIIDFTEVHNKKQLDEILNQKYVIDKFPDKEIGVFSDEINSKLHQAFIPNSIVPCKEILK